MPVYRALIIACMLTVIVMAGASVPAQDAFDEPPPIADPSIPGVEIEGNGDAYYTIRKGDTLWDLSRRFLDSPYEWPSLWEYNSDTPITNPHLIYPGQRIKLRRKADMAPPSPTYPAVPPEIAPSETEMADAPDAAVDDGAAESSPAAGFDTDLYGDGGLTQYLYTSINRVGFIRRQAVKPHGTIFKVLEDKEMVSKGDTVYIRKIGTIPLIVGKYYTVYRTLRPEVSEGGGEWTQHYFTGLVEITRHEDRYAMGVIRQSYRTIRVEDNLIPYTERSPKIVFTESRSGLKGKILAPEEKSTIMGEHSVAFIDQGADNGVAPGQRYTIYEQNQAFVSSKDTRPVTLPPVNFGTLLVLRAESDSATVLITRSQRNITPGDRFRAAEP